MEQMAPAPLVPEMPTVTTESCQYTGRATDGGTKRPLPERTFGAPLVPDHR
jgi:hypothetical protein